MFSFDWQYSSTSVVCCEGLLMNKVMWLIMWLLWFSVSHIIDRHCMTSNVVWLILVLHEVCLWYLCSCFTWMFRLTSWHWLLMLLCKICLVWFYLDVMDYMWYSREQWSRFVLCSREWMLMLCLGGFGGLAPSSDGLQMVTFPHNWNENRSEAAWMQISPWEPQMLKRFYSQQTWNNVW